MAAVPLFLVALALMVAAIAAMIYWANGKFPPAWRLVDGLGRTDGTRCVLLRLA